MASIQSVIDLIFNGVDNASGTIKGISGNLGALDQAAQGIAAPFASLADSLLKAEAAVLALGAAVGILAIRETVKFQDSLYLVDKQLQGSGVALDDAREKIEALGLQYGINANEIAASMAGFLAGGNDFKQSAILVETALQFMIAGEIEATKATDILTASLAGWRIPTAEAAAGAQKVGDILNKLADISQSRLLEPIADAFTRVAPAAYTAGLTMEETGAIVARLVDVFQSGEIAGSALSSGLSALSAPTAAATKAIEALGISVRDQNGDLRSSGDILKDLAANWGTLTAAQQAEAAAIIFGKEQADKFKVVLGDWAKIQDYLNQTLDETTGAVGSLARETEAKLKLISSAVATANESWRQFLENLGAKITTGGALQDLIKDFGSLGIAFKDVVNQGGFDPLVELLQSQFGDISNLIESIAKNLPKAFKGLDWSGVTDSLKGLQGEVGGVFEAFFGEIDLTTVEGLKSALQTVIKTFEVLTIAVTGIVSEFKPLAAFFGDLIRGFNDLDKSSQLDFGKFLGAMKLVVDAGTGLGLALIAIGRAGLDMAGTIDTAFGVVKVAVNGVQTAYLAVVEDILKVKKAILESKIEDLGPNAEGSARWEEYQKQLAAVQIELDRVTKELNRNKGELDEGVGMITGNTAALDKNKEQLDKNEAALIKIREANKKQGDQTRENTVALQDWSDGLRQEAELLEKNKNHYADSTKKLMDWSDGLKDAKQATIAWGDAITGLPPIKPPEGVEKIEGVFTAAGKAAGDYAQSMEGISTSYSQIGSGTVKATGAFAAVADKTQDAKDQLDALTQSGKLTVEQLIEITANANEFKLKMEEIASNERIKKIEAAVELNVAGLEADVKRVQSLFASIDTTINSTGDLLGSLFGNLVDTDSRWKELEIQEQIDLENKRRQEALDIQKKLAEAEIARIEAQTRSLNRGDALIKITGDGLETELEAFMWKILSKIRVRANAEFADYLLGLGVTA